MCIEATMLASSMCVAVWICTKISISLHNVITSPFYNRIVYQGYISLMMIEICVFGLETFWLLWARRIHFWVWIQIAAVFSRCVCLSVLLCVFVCACGSGCLCFCFEFPRFPATIFWMASLRFDAIPLKVLLVVCCLPACPPAQHTYHAFEA